MYIYTPYIYIYARKAYEDDDDDDDPLQLYYTPFHDITHTHAHTHTHIYIHKDFGCGGGGGGGGGTLGRRPTINLPTFIRGRRSRAFLASIILSYTPPARCHRICLCIYLSPLYPEGFPKNSGPRLYIYNICV